MNACLPYTFLVNDLFRCLFADLNIPFTEAPVPGKYTRKIGQSLSAHTLCEGLESVLGSAMECYYLGADTLFFFAPCGNCSSERIKTKLQNCLKADGVPMNLIALAPDYAAQKQFWATLKAVSPVPYFLWKDARRRFYACADLLCEFAQVLSHLREDAACRHYAESYLHELQRAKSLLRLKALLAAFLKKRAILQTPLKAVALSGENLPYLQADYFGLPGESSGARWVAYFSKKSKGSPSLTPAHSCTRCPAKGDTALFLNV